jgi:molybdate transport system permease protein
MPAHPYTPGLLTGAAGSAAAIAAVAGTWLGWTLAGRPVALSARAAGALTWIVLALPAPVVTYFLWMALGRFGAPGAAGLAAAGVVSAAPIVARASRTAFLALDPAVVNAARGLGAAEWRVFMRVGLPLAWRPVAAGWLLAVVRLMAEMAAVRWLAARMLP